MLVALALPLLWLDLFSIPLSPITPRLDSSWSGALVHFAARRLQFGKDVIFTYGPLGHLINYVYTGELFSTRVAWEFLSKTLFVAILCVSTVYLPRLWRPVFFLFVLLFIWADGSADSLYVLIISYLAVFLFQQGNSKPALNIFVGTLFAVISLLKFTFLLLIVGALGLAFTCYWYQRKVAYTILLGSVFVTAFLFSWWIAGQQCSNVFSYLRTSLDICFGYKEAMGLPAASTAVMLAGLAAALLSVVQCALLFLASRQVPVFFATLFVVGETFLSWNRAFIRADDHVLSFFCVCPVVLLSPWIVAQPRAHVRWIGYATNLLVFLFCLLGISLQKPTALKHCILDATVRIKQSWTVVTDLRKTATQLRLRLAETRSAYALPRVQAEVRQETVDVFGYGQGIALLNGLNYTPRPIFQSYSAYTPALIRLNTDFYSSTQAPAYVLFQHQSIDNRYPTLDDAGSLKQLLYNYKPLFEENDYSLWKRIRPPEPVHFSDATTGSLPFDSETAIPADKIGWLQLNVRKSLQGRVLSLFYRPPIVTIRVTDMLGKRISHRLIPSMSSTGFIINPYLMTSAQVLHTAAGLKDAPVVSFSVHVPEEARRFFQERISFRMSTLPQVPRTEMEGQAKRPAVVATGEKEEASEDRLIQAFNASGEVLLRLDPPNRFEGLSPLGETRLTSGTNGFRITAMGTRPQILLPPFPTGTQGGALARIDLKAPADADLQLSYLPSGVSVYGNHVLNRSLRRGENTIYFFLTDLQLAGGRVRVDFGMSARGYLITTLEIRAVSPESLSNP